MNCAEASELITALVDDELSHVERSALKTHLDNCPRCQTAYEEERALKQEIRSSSLAISAPAGLRRNILSRHGIFPVEAPSSVAWWSWSAAIFRPVLRPALGFILILLLMVPVIYFVRPHSRPISLATVDIQEKIARGEISLRAAANRDEFRDWQSRAVDGKYPPMEYDLSAMNVRPVGGLIQEIGGRKILAVVYGGNDQSVTCFTFLGTEQDAPKAAARVFDRGKNTTFYTFADSGYNAVLHREGPVICIFVSKMQMSDLLALARKAQPA